NRLRYLTQTDLRMDEVPQLGDLPRRLAGRRRFEDGAAINHRGGIFGALMQHHRRYPAVLRQSSGGLHSDVGPLCRTVKHKYERLTGASTHLDRRADSAQIVR